MVLFETKYLFFNQSHFSVRPFSPTSQKIEIIFDSKNSHKQKTMSVQIVQKKVIEGEFIVKKTGKKMFIVDFVDVKQYWFQEEVWEIIKEFIITSRSKLLLRTRNLSIPVLSKIYSKYFNIKVTNINNSKVPLESRKKLLTEGIIIKCEQNPRKYDEIMETEFKVKPQYWTENYEIGDVVLALEGVRMGKVQYRYKSSIKIALFDFEDVDVVKGNTTYHYRRWNPEIDKVITIKKRSGVTSQKELSSRYIPSYRWHYDNIFETGCIGSSGGF